MPIGDFADMMPQTLTYRAFTGYDVNGKPTYSGSTVSYSCRVVEKPKRVASRVTGDDVISSTQVWILGIISGLSVDDEVTLPDGTKPIILGWEQYPDESGDHHTKLLMQRKNA